MGAILRNEGKGPLRIRPAQSAQVEYRVFAASGFQGAGRRPGHLAVPLYRGLRRVNHG
jgi:hypothetical protein